MIRALLCLLGFHQLPEGVEPKWSFRWSCDHCGAISDGALARRKR